MDSDAAEIASATARMSTELGIRLDRLRVTVEAATNQLQQLNSNIQDASQSSKRLALALNWLTAVAGVVAFLGVVVAALALWRSWG